MTGINTTNQLIFAKPTSLTTANTNEQITAKLNKLKSELLVIQ